MNENEWNTVYKCSNKKCSNNINNITPDDLLPSYDSNGYEDFLIFLVKCPNCGLYSEFPMSLIPIDVARNVMNKYSGGKSRIMLKIWELNYKRKLIEEQIEELNKKYQTMDENMSPENKNRLFQHWMTNENLLEQEKNRFQKIKK